LKLLRKNYNKSVIRKLYPKRKDRNSILFNIPWKFAKNKNMNAGDYIQVIEVEEGLLLKKVDMED
jgi:hypothetical protein